MTCTEESQGERDEEGHEIFCFIGEPPRNPHGIPCLLNLLVVEIETDVV